MAAGLSFSLRSSRLPCLLFVLLGSFSFANSDFASDRAECADQLTGLATCVPYVENQARTPTPDCCSGLKQVLAKSRKCLCVLIKDRDEPGLGIKINVTTALLLPSVCRAIYNISECPKLLNLAPNSKEAQIFEQFGNLTKATAPSPSRSLSDGGATARESSGGSSNHRGVKRWLGEGKVGAMSSPFLLLLLLLVAHLVLGG